jgi:hypothetical protein
MYAWLFWRQGKIGCMDQRQQIVTAFCEECVWARSVRTHFKELFESGEARHQLLAETAKTFFQDLNLILHEYVLLQQCKLTDPASSGKDKINLSTNHILSLGWNPETEKSLRAANDKLSAFRQKIVEARRTLVAHSDLRSRLQPLALGGFTEAEEHDFWCALQCFANAAHMEAAGGPFEIDATMPEGDAVSLVHRLADAVDYDDLVESDAQLLTHRLDRKRYGNI